MDSATYWVLGACGEFTAVGNDDIGRGPVVSLIDYRNGFNPRHFEPMFQSQITIIEAQQIKTRAMVRYTYGLRSSPCQQVDRISRIARS